MYTKDEVRALLDDAAAKIKSTMESELENSAHSTDLLLRQMMQQAEQTNTQLRLDTNQLEDEYLLQEVRSHAGLTHTGRTQHFWKPHGQFWQLYCIIPACSKCN